MSKADPHVAARFKAARLRAGFSQAAAAADLHTDVNTISRWERGRHPIPAAAFVQAEAWPAKGAHTSRRDDTPITSRLPVIPAGADELPGFWFGVLYDAHERIADAVRVQESAATTQEHATATIKQANAAIGKANARLAQMIGQRGAWLAPPRAGHPLTLPSTTPVPRPEESDGTGEQSA
ncbi:hypothetical protein tb265_39250 [Gemmatimonadetes bacterium T265]|nr:hypothetical protein tb265_39250 [Gemmatimonadetes bacterium T265]